MRVILDPNQRWENLGETKRFLKELEKIGNVFCLEDPIPFWMIEDYKTLRKMTSIKIVRHVSLPYIYQGQRSHQAIQFIKNEAADGFNFNGGIVGFSQLDAIASVANMYSWHGSEVDLGILEARYLHSVSASSHCIWPCDIFGRMIREHDLLKTPLKIKPPYAYLPEGSFGLGVELDNEALLRYKIKEKLIQ